MMSSEIFIQVFQIVGDTLHVDEHLVSGIEHYVCKLFGSSKTDLDQARVELFKRGKFSEELLPPTRKALHYHLQRANFQALVWKRALLCHMDLPSPNDHGWQINDNSITIDWNVEAIADVSGLTVCSCKGGCNTKSCKCKKHNLKCADACLCKDCKNTVAGDKDEEDEDNVEGTSAAANNDDADDDSDSDEEDEDEVNDEIDFQNEDSIDFNIIF